MVLSMIAQNKSALFSVGALIAASVALYALRVVPNSIAVLGIGILWISMLPSIIYLSTAKSAPIPFLPATGFYYAAFFGLNVFTIPLAWKDATSVVINGLVPVGEIRIEVLLIVFAGISGLIAVFYVSRYLIFQRFAQFCLPQTILLANLSPLYWVLLLAHISYEYIPALATLPSIGQFLGPVGFLAFGGLFLLWRRQQLSKFEAILLFIVFIPLEIYWRIRILFLTDIILFLIFFILLFWRERMLKLLGLCCVTVCLLLLVYGASTVTRGIVTTVSGPEKLLVTGKAIYLLLFQNKYVVNLHKGNRVVFAGRFGSLTMRTGQLWVFHIVDNKSPEEVPYWKGKSYRPLMTSFVPRVFYPNKLEERAGGEFGRSYGFIQPDNFHVSINIPWITELLVNFGRWGVIWGMMTFGLFLAFLDRVFNSEDATDLEFVFGLTLIFPLVYPESNFSVMTGSLLPLFISLYVYFTGGAWVLNKISIFRRAE